MSACKSRSGASGLMLLGSLISIAAAMSGAASALRTIEPKILESRTLDVTQTVTLNDIPKDSKQLRMWVPIPSDASWQRVIHSEVISAPGTWKIVRQGEGRGSFVYVELDNPPAGAANVVIRYVVDRQAVHFSLDAADASSSMQPALFVDALNAKAPLMEVDARIKKLADEACGNEKDPIRQAVILMKKVAEVSDHYSKDASKPKCGRGSAEDCLEHGGGCCTDLHSLFIALARARGIPARMQYGYRMLDAKAGSSYDPGYRCWIEFFAPGAGWIPNDIVASDSKDMDAPPNADNPMRWGTLSATRVWLWEGRSFELTPKAKAGPINTMICGWAEIDGKPVEVIGSADGKIPSKLVRTVKFDVLKKDQPEGAPKLPE